MDFLKVSKLFSNSDEIFEKATSENIQIGTEDLVTNLAIADKIKAKEIPAKQAINSLKKRLTHKNPNVQILAIKLSDFLIKNCGAHFHSEFVARDFFDFFVANARDYTVTESVRMKALEIIQNCGVGFKNKPELGYAVEIYNQMKRDGVQFPRLAIAADSFSSLLDTAVAPEWSDSDSCTRCRTAFTTFNRKHHCRNCGKTFCQECSSKKIALPKLGINEEVRVCDPCHYKISNNAPVDRVSENKGSDANNTSPSEDADLAKAIAESLRISGKEESKAQQAPYFRSRQSNDLEENDPELRRAIEESLKVSRSTEKPTGSFSRTSENYSNYPSVSAVTEQHVVASQEQQSYRPAASPGVGSHNVTKIELSNITLFSELVEKTAATASHRGISTLNPYQLSQLSGLFAQVQAIAPKLLTTLAETAGKYKQLYEMNEEISKLVADYDAMIRNREMYRYNAGQKHYPVGHNRRWVDAGAHSNFYAEHNVAPVAPYQPHNQFANAVNQAPSSGTLPPHQQQYVSSQAFVPERTYFAPQQYSGSEQHASYVGANAYTAAPIDNQNKPQQSGSVAPPVVQDAPLIEF